MALVLMIRILEKPDIVCESEIIFLGLREVP